jgi:hypothetical protein
MLCAPGLVLSGSEGVGSCFHALRCRTHFRRYRGRQMPFSCFVLPDSFSAVARASGAIFMFCAPEFVFGGTDDAGSRFHVLRSQTHFLQYRRHRVLFSCITLSVSFWAAPIAPGLVFIFCAPGHVLGCTECAWSHFHVLRSQTHFR